MATTKSNIQMLRNNKKEKHHHKGKSKTKKESLHFDSRTDHPFVMTRNSKNDDINNFWKYSRKNPFSIKKCKKFEPSKDVIITSTSSFNKNKPRITPKFSTISSVGKMSSILSRRESDNTAAVIEARREIEKIKTELETLINANVKTQSLYTESMSLIPPDIETLLSTAADACNTLADTPEEPNEPVKLNSQKPTIRSSVMSPTTPNRRRSVVPDDAPTVETTRPKSRPYDPEKTREFIKKQKLRRKEKLLEEEQKKQQKEFARKNKLDELKKKTLELVAKNLKKSTCKSAKSPSDVHTNNTSKSIAQIDNNNKTTVNKFLLQSRRCRARSFDDVNRDKETNFKRSRSVSRDVNSKQAEHKNAENQTLATTKSQSSSQKSLTPKITDKVPQQKETTKKLDSPPKIIEINETSSLASAKENMKTQSPPNTKQKEISINLTLNSQSPITKQNDEYETTDAAKELTEIKQKLETSITQLKEKNDIPVWLQPPSSVPYPYNFISAVRKKLEYVTRKPNKLDKNDENHKLNVSVQCTIDKVQDVSNDQKKFDKKVLDVNSVNIPKLKSPAKLESPRNRTYESHKCRRQLYPNINIPQINTNEIEININKSDSDSDTTKNIPELPHEETAQPVTNITKFEETKTNITFDKSKDNFSRDNSKLSLAPSDISSRLKNITFERNIPPKLNMGDIKLPEPEKYVGLVAPNDKIEMPQKTTRNSRKSRSKYPDDIDSILSHYSKMKSEQNSYSDDFNSISGSASSKPEKRTNTKSITEYKEIPSFSKTTTSISEHVPRTHSNSSSKENISEENNKKASSKSRTVSTETNLTMKGVPSLSKQSDSVVEPTTIQTESSKREKTESSFSLKQKESEDKSVVSKKLTKPEVVLKRRADEIENNPNHIHLKLQAEVHLLNSFNNSLKQVVAVEKSLFEAAPSTSNFNAINCKRGCDFTANDGATPQNTTNLKNFPNTSFKNLSNNSFKNFSNTSFNVSNATLKSVKEQRVEDVDDDTSVCSQDLGMSNVIDRSSISTTFATNSVVSRRGEDNLDLKSHPYVAISLDMVDQMIKDEDIRLEHLKAVLKLRDQALFDRIKGELALLEIRKRELRENGQTNDITAIKKKQRGLIIKLQQERHEMQRLKTAHKQAAKARKSALHEQKSIIKTQLSSTDQIPKKLRRLSHLERPSLGPVKVYRVDSRTEFSETTVSRKGSDDSVTNSSVLTQISEKISVEKSEIFYADSLAVVEPVKSKHSNTSAQSEKLKRSLLMKEAEIDKRRKEIEELIKWQRRLKQKEAEVVELERQAVKSLQSDENQENVRVFTGAHLNKVWKGIALPDKNFDEHKKYQMSKRSLDKFYQNARKMFKEVSDDERRSKVDTYSSEFEQTNSASRLDLSSTVVSLNDVEVQTKMVAERLRHISDIISVPENTSSEDVSSIQEDNKSVSVSAISESQSVNTEVNALLNKSDSKILSIHSEFNDSLQNKSPSKSLELLIASESSARKPDESNSIISESLKTDSLEKSSEQKILTENSSSKFFKSAEKPHSTSIVSENTTAKTESELGSIPQASDKSESQILDSINSSVKSEKSALAPTSTSIPEISEKSESQALENIDSLISSAKSKCDVKSILETSEYSKHEISENATVKSSSDIKSILDESHKSEPQHLEDIVSIISSAKSDSLPETPEKTEPQIIENIDSLKSSTTSVPKSISELHQPSESEQSKHEILENIDSLNSSVKSEINSLEHKSISEFDEASEKSDPSEHQTPENIPTAKSSESDKQQIQENIVSETSSSKSISESPEKSITQAQEHIPTSGESNKIESWEPQIISDIKSDSSEKEVTIKSENLEGNSAIPEKSSNTQSIVESKIFDEPDTKSKTNSETHVSEQNIQSDTPRSEFHYETDFDKFSESDQSKIETESNVSLKETNVDSSINEDESEDHSGNRTPVVSSEVKLEEAAEISSEIKPEETKEISSELKPEETEEISSELKPEEISSELKPEDTEEIQESDVFEASSSKVTSESAGHSSDTIKASPKDPESQIISEEAAASEHFDRSSESPDDDLNDSKKGVSHIDVRKRVSEILADANGPRGDKSPRVQDLYTTTYDIPESAESTPESGSPTNEFSKQEKASFSPETTPYVNEAEELLRKQLEIEQEIKRLERQQQNIPYLFMREIPNKPPPPYKPPDFPLTPVIASIIPSKPEQTKRIINDATDILYGAYSSGGDLMKTSSETKDDQQKFMFDLCKEIAIEACKPTIETKIPSWRSHKNKFQNLFVKRPVTKDHLNSVLNRKVLQLLNFEPVTRNDSLIIRWSRKKRDHVDEILVSETQAEEVEWTNFDSDEEIIKDNLTQSILDLLIVDAAKDFNDILMNNKKRLSWSDC